MYTENYTAHVDAVKKFPAGYRVDVTLSNGQKVAITMVEQEYAVGTKLKIFASTGTFTTYCIQGVISDVPTSHLTTICDRVERRLKNFDGNEKEAAKDPLFKQAVSNLREYQENWDDFTKAEQERADTLYAKYIHLTKT